MGKRNTHAVRVIAGEYKGRRLSYPDGRVLRPTMDKAREALFSAIGDLIWGRVFVDLFSAAGSVGLEALSRGASLVHFVENDRKALDCLRENLDALAVEAPRYRLYPQDVFGYLDGGQLRPLPDAIVFADPPYDSDDASILLTHFRDTRYHNMLLFILEHRKPVAAPELGTLSFSKTKQYGETSLSFWARPG